MASRHLLSCIGFFRHSTSLGCRSLLNTSTSNSLPFVFPCVDNAGRMLSSLATRSTYAMCSQSNQNLPTTVFGPDRGNVGKGTLLQLFPVALNVNLVQTRTYISVLRPRLRCEGCYFVWRHGRKFVECSDHPSHKQMKKIATRKVWREDYSKGRIKQAMVWNRVQDRHFMRNVDKNSVSHSWCADSLGKDV